MKGLALGAVLKPLSPEPVSPMEEHAWKCEWQLSLRVNPVNTGTAGATAFQ